MGSEAEGSIEDRVATLERALAEKEREVEALRAELTRFRSMIEHAPVGVVQDDEARRCTYVNRAYCEILGLTLDDALAGNWVSFLHPDDLAVLAPQFVAAAKQGVPFASDVRLLRPNGEVRWVHAQSVSLRGKDGERLGRVGTVTDITARKETQAALEEARATLEEHVELRSAELRKANDELKIFGALAEHTADAVVIASPEGDVTHVSPAYRRMFACGDEVLGAPLVDVLRPSDQAAREELYGALIDGSAYRGMVMLRGANGELLPAQVDCYVVRTGPEEVLGLAAVIRDLTGDQRAEAERAELEARVIASQEALIRELSTPLLPIAEGVIVMPLVGSIGDARAEQILNALLAGIQAHGAKTAILDITGVSMVDTYAANVLISAAQAARLLGTNVIISGIGATVARTLVELGVDLGGTMTKSTLAGAIAFAVGRRR